MAGYAFVLVAISLALLPVGRGRFSSKLNLWCLILIALCYVGLIALAFNVEGTVVKGDQSVAQTATPWFGSYWLWAALIDVAIIAVLHVVIIVNRGYSVES